MPLDLLYPVALLLVTGHGYLAGYIPESWTTFLTEHNVYSLKTMLWWMTGINALKASACLLAMCCTSRKKILYTK